MRSLIDKLKALRRWKVISSLIDQIQKGHERSVKAKKNILASFLIKGLSIIISLVLVPLTIKYVNPTQYGIWITLSSIIGWFSFFDIGFGHGLRNKFAESIAREDHTKARIFVSTTYASLSIIVIVVILTFYLINPFLNWANILNTSDEMAHELGILVLIVFTFFCIQLVLNLLTTVLTADQQPAKASFILVIGNLISLILILILTKTTSGNLIYLGIALSISPFIVLLFSSIWFYTNEYRKYAPSIKFVNFKYTSTLMSLGLKFFLLNVAGIVLYQTSNIIIAQIFGPKEVTPYNIAYKYFSLIPMVMGIITMPFWSAYTEAWVKKDIKWIKKTIKNLQLIWGLSVLVTIIMLVFANTLYRLWVGNEIKVPFTVSISLAAYVISLGWTNIYTMLLNGTGKIKLQLYSSLIGTLINIPMAIYLCKLFGIAGVILSTLILGIVNMIIEPIQTRKILHGTAEGIWDQ